MNPATFSLLDKVAVVVGAASPIGQALAVALAEAGAQVAVTTMLPTQREAGMVAHCAESIQALQRTGLTFTIDTTQESDVATVMQQTVAQLGRVDILVNAPDLPFAKPLPEVTLAEWQRVLSVNLTSVYLTCRAASEPMQAQGHGRIINVVSVLGERGMANGSAYCAAQAGVLNLSRALALEWARRGITVNAIGAGWTEGMGMLADEQLKQQIVRYIPSKRLAQPQEIGDAVVYLASEVSGFVTGQVIWIEGGVLSRL
ncbi:MAG: SDR family NAD(P)-dependent oxidoreductase [Candidatus Binatia bacterium]